MAAYSIPELKTKIQKFPKQDLIHLPTPFKKLENLSEEMGGPNIYIKRDDMTGLAFGGNKSRKLEFIMQDVLDKNADVIITWAGLQSNWCLQTAAAARKFGITPILILFNVYDLPEEFDGNLLLDLILSADIKIKEMGKGNILHMEDVDEILEDTAKEVIRGGQTPYIAPIGGSAAGGSMGDPLGAISYVNAYVEMVEQAEEMDMDVDYVLHASGSGGTQAGLAVGAKALSDKAKILGVSVADEKNTYTDYVLDIASDTQTALDLDLEIEKKNIIVFDEYLGEGYGEMNKEVAEAIQLMSMKEGLFLDLVKKGYFEKEDNVVFFHTGGTAALFPNKLKLGKYLGG